MTSRKWRQFSDAVQAKALVDGQQPSRIYSLSTDGCTPTGIMGHPGFCYVIGSNFSAPVSSNGVNIVGELVAVCTSGTLTKVYPYDFGTSTDRSLCFRGPHKHNPMHHIQPGQSFSNADLFGYTPGASAGFVPGGSTMTVTPMTPSLLSTYPTFGTNDPSRSMLITTATSCNTSSRSS
jgi:hypothetical protein